MFERCLVPDIPSATTAASNDSSAARKAIVTAGENICFTSDSDIRDVGNGRWLGTLPNRAPIVATGKLKSFDY